MRGNPFPRLMQSAVEAVPDATLLRRYVADRDHAAFELLARRHADAVWTACRQILRHDADAEDAFQATFLALAKKAGTLRESGTLGGWLYKVAVNAALKLRERRPDRQGGLEGHALPDGRASASELETPAHEELARLSDKYRLPVVLCDLEGHTHAEAAAVLGWPIGTVSGRLSRARDQLKTRLLRRGIVAPAVLTMTAVDSALAGRAAAAALGLSAIPASVSTLTEGVLAAMSTIKLKLVAASAGAMICLAGVGTYVAIAQTTGSKSEARQPQIGDDRSGTLLKREVRKLKNGRLTAYPDLVLDPDPVSGYKMPDGSVIWKLVDDIGNIPRKTSDNFTWTEFDNSEKQFGSTMKC